VGGGGEKNKKEEPIKKKKNKMGCQVEKEKHKADIGCF